MKGDDFGVVDEPVDHGCGDDLVAEDFTPSAERFCCGADDQAGAFSTGWRRVWKNRSAASGSKGM